MKRLFILFLVIFFGMGFAFGLNSKSIKISQWNMQTFFDDITEGTEYSDYINNDKWNKDCYDLRLKRAVSVIKSLSSDILILEEVENKGVLESIDALLKQKGGFFAGFRYGAFYRSKGCGLGVGLLSKIPIKDIKIHEVYSDDNAPLMRAIVEVTVSYKKKDMVLFINHWKSPTGGVLQTENWRQLQEKSLYYAVNQAEKHCKSILLAGDFNKDVMAFNQGEESSILLYGKTPFYYKKDTDFYGSYYYQEQWSMIDFFYFCGLKVNKVNVERDGFWCYEDTYIPKRFTLWNQSGYSDHLPVSCEVELY